MTKIQKSVLINAPINEVEAILDNPHRLPEWYAGVTAVQPTANFPQEIGSSNKLTYKAGGLTMESTLTTIESVPQQKRIFQMDGMISGTNHWQLQANGRQTQVQFTMDYQMGGGGLGQLANKLIIERMNDKNADESLANLKQLVEG